MQMVKGVMLFVVMAVMGYFWVVWNNNRIAKEAEPFIYSSVTQLPKKKAGLVLGTSKYLSGGRINYFYRYRIDTAERLFKAGKIDAIVVSGDNGREGYDEPSEMYHDLIARGIPSQYITLDYAGFRTLDSIVRAEAIFDLHDYTIISQRFHLERAIYLAHAKGQNVIGFVAKDFKDTVWAKRMAHRELLARAKAFLDLHILKKEPKFYGSKVKVNYRK